jgi:anthranilate phosphoribosyltransferase
LPYYKDDTASLLLHGRLARPKTTKIPVSVHFRFVLHLPNRKMSRLLNELTKHLTQGHSLDDAQVTEAISALLDPAPTPELKAEFLLALAKKGETADEIAAFATGLRAHSRQVELPLSPSGLPLLDVVGTGGDSAGTFNISTCVAILCAAAGLPVAKHGNRAATSKCGSADVLEELGIPINLDPSQAIEHFKTHNFVFLFAPNFHPTFAQVAPARKLCAQRGQKTIFNLLGPLLNPAGPQAILAGVPRPGLCEIMATAMKNIGIGRAMVVCGEMDDATEGRYLDEISTSGSTSLSEFYHDRGLFNGTIEPEAFGLARASLKDLAGPDRKQNALILTAILEGRETGPKLDAVVLNAAAALYVGRAARSIQEGLELARTTILSGKSARKLASLQG